MCATWAALLQRAGFALPVADVERLTVRYGDFSALVRDLRAHGLTNVLAERSRQPLRRDTLAALLAHYAAHHADTDGKLLAQFETLYLTGWAPHESQQKPLKPGSAQGAPGRCAGHHRASYFRFADTSVKKVDSLVPTVVTPATITIEIRLAIRAYSIAVAPLVSAAKSLHKRSRSMGISGKSAAGMG